MGSNRLHIRRFDAQYLVPRDHPAPERLKVRIDDAVAQHLLGHTLTHALGNFFSDTDESIWLIRRLELDVTVNAAWERDQLTRVISAQFARGLGTALQDDTSDGNVVRFANRAAYLARFLSDVAAGAAWGKWYYESFAGLRPLSTSATLRTAVCNEPDAGPAALLALDGHELKRVLRALTEHDARRILDHFAANTTESNEVRCCEAAWIASQGIELNGGEWSQVLHLFLLTIRRHADVGGAALRRSVVALVQLQRVIAESSPHETQRILSALTNANLASLYLAAGTAEAEKLKPLLLCPPPWVKEVSETLLAGKEGVTKSETDQVGRRVTSFGGIFLLLPLVDELPLAEATRDWPPADDTAAVDLVRYLLLIKCCGQRNAHRVFYDPLWRDLLLIPPTISPLAIREWSTDITPAQTESFLETIGFEDGVESVLVDDKRSHDLSYLTLPDSLRLSPELDCVLSVAAQNLLRSFSWRLPGFASSSLPYLSTNFLDFSGSLEEEPRRRLVRLGRPPLHLILNLTGKSRQTYRLSWLDERPFSLFPED